MSKLARVAATAVVMMVSMAVVEASSKIHTIDGWGSTFNATEWLKANRRSCYPGDKVVFKYKLSNATVIKLGQTSYEHCTVDGEEVHDNPKDDFLLEIGTNYFIDGFSCNQGMKVAIST